MRDFAARLGRLGDVESFDYPYQTMGRRAPDPLPKLVRAHRAALESLQKVSERDVVLVGKSMGGRVGCHLALEPVKPAPLALVCLGYPLVAGKRMRDEVLLALETPVLFVQGTRDPMCPIEQLERVRQRMKARNHLHLVEGGDHSLRVTAAQMRRSGCDQGFVFDRVVDAIGAFLMEL